MRPFLATTVALLSLGLCACEKLGQAMDRASAPQQARAPSGNRAVLMSSKPLPAPADLRTALREGYLREAGRRDCEAWLAIAAAATRPPAQPPRLDCGRLERAYVVLKPLRMNHFSFAQPPAKYFVPKGNDRPAGEIGDSLLYDANEIFCMGLGCNEAQPSLPIWNPQ